MRYCANLCLLCAESAVFEWHVWSWENRSDATEFVCLGVCIVERSEEREFAERDKERRQREGVELSSRTARSAFWKYIRAKYFGQTHRVVEQRLACAPRKTHRKNRITTSALARNIKNIRWGYTRSVERKNKAGSALAPKGFIDASPFRNEIWWRSLGSRNDLMQRFPFIPWK